MEPTYYRLDVSKVKYTECWRATRSWLEFVLICLVKTFRMSFLNTYAMTNEGYERVAWDGLFSDVQRAFQTARQEFELAGFQYRFCYRFPGLGSMVSTTTVLISDDGNSTASMKCERHQAGSVVTCTMTTSIVSEMANGQFLIHVQQGDLFCDTAALQCECSARADQTAATDDADFHSS